MIKIFSTDKVRELDKYTIQNEPISSIDLVERAATVFTSEFCRRYSKQTRIIVFAGQGNNGADALAIARMLTDAGYRVETYLFNPTMRLSDDCELNKQRLLHMEKIEFTEVVDDFVPPELEERDVVIDGLFGSGLNRPLTGGFAAMVRYINQSNATVVAIDIPSGLFGEDNRKNDPDAIIHADLTLTFGFPKLAFLLPENAEFVGEWKVLDILLHPEIIASTPTQFTLVTEEDIAAVFQPRNRFAYKGTFGHALLIAGSHGKMGAALLSALILSPCASFSLVSASPDVASRFCRLPFQKRWLIWINIKIISALFPVSKPTPQSRSGLVWDNIRIPSKLWNNYSK